MQEQMEAGVETLIHGTEQLIYTDQGHCTSCMVTQNLNRSSEARATRNFRVIDVPNGLLLDEATNYIYIKEDTVAEIFDTHVVSYKTMEGTLLKINEQVEANVEGEAIL